MTHEEGIQFCDEVLTGNWPKWTFTETVAGEWAKRLWKFDYLKARKVITDFAFSYTKQGHPPAGQIFAILYKAARLPKEQRNTDTVPLYTIIRPDGRPAGFPVTSAKGIPSDVEAVRRQADVLCANVARGREGYYVQYLEESIAPEVPF